MQENITYLERILTFLLLPATLLGACGAFFSTARKGKPPLHVVIEMVGGAITTNMLSPLIEKYVSVDFYYTLFFFAGYGGLKLADRIYEAFVSAVESRIRKQINPGNDRE